MPFIPAPTKPPKPPRTLPSNLKPLFPTGKPGIGETLTLIKPPKDLGRPTGPRITDTAPRVPPNISINSGAAYRPIAPLYGATRVVGNIGLVREKSGHWIVLYVFGRGPWENIDTLYINNDDGLDVSSNSGGATFTNSALFGGTGSARIFEGTSGQDVGGDFLTAFVASFTDALNDGDDPGVVCIAMELRPDAQREPPRIEADCRGVAVFDPRTSSTAYSNNGALVLADYITNSDWGHGGTIDWDSVSDCADNADDSLGGGVRFECNLHLNKRQTTLDYIQHLQTYAGCFVQERGGTFYLIPDRPRAKVFDVGRNIIIRGTGSLRRGIGRANKPTDVVVTWYDKANNVQKEAYAIGGTTGAVARVDAPGITNYQQALRTAVMHYNHIALEDLTYSALCRDEALQFEIGDLHAITDPTNGLSDKYMWMSQKTMETPGRWRCTWTEYQEAAYSDSVASDPVTVDTTLPNPNSPPTLAGLTNTRNYEQDTGSDDISHYVDVTWTDPAWLFTDVVQVQFWTFDPVGSTLEKLIAQSEIPENQQAVRFYFPEGAKLQTTHTYKTRIRIRSKSGVLGAWTTSSGFAPANDPTPPKPAWCRVTKDETSNAVLIDMPSNVPNYIRWIWIREDGGDLGQQEVVETNDHKFDIPYLQTGSQSESSGNFQTSTTYTWEVSYVNRDETISATPHTSDTLTW